MHRIGARRGLFGRVAMVAGSGVRDGLGRERRQGEKMGGRRPVLVGLLLVMALGCAIYFRLWTIDYTLSSDETELLRRQFDLANREAMDESAEWRLKYDEEVERATKCLHELIKIKEFSDKKVEDAFSTDHKLTILQKENSALLERVESLKQELEAEKLKCSLQ